MFLPDINFWLTLTFDLHIHHSTAKRWFEGHPEKTFFFCRFTQQGFLRLASNLKAFGEEAVSLHDGWQLYDKILTDSRIMLVVEPENIELYWRTYTDLSALSPKLSSDAYLAAFARAAGLQLITFDQGFRQFKDVNCTILA